MLTEEESPDQDKVVDETKNGSTVCLGCQQSYDKSCLTLAADDTGLKFCPSCIKVESKANIFNGLSKFKRVSSMAYLTGSTPFVEELKKRTFRSGEEIVVRASASDLTESYFKENGFSKPIIIMDPNGLDLKLPPFTDYAAIQRHLASCSSRSMTLFQQGITEVEVIDVETQAQFTMPLNKFFEYIMSDDRSRILNVISMEVSETRLADMIEPPAIVRRLDWSHIFWGEPKEGHPPPLPKQVEKYCLISAANSFTDFHIDFSGTSVWYHVVKGVKKFYLIKPSITNSTLFWNWFNSNNRLRTLFADQADDCYCITIRPGQTLLLPTGWIHAVLTLEESLVYGGNFLNTYNVPEQLEIYNTETKQNTPPRFLYPYYKELNWFAAQGLCQELTYYNSMKFRAAPPYLVSALRSLLTYLKVWIYDLPPNLRNYYGSENLIKEIGKQLRKSEKQSMIINPPKPERESKRIKKKPSFTDYVCYEELKFINKNKTPAKLLNKPTNKNSYQLTNSAPQPVVKPKHTDNTVKDEYEMKTFGDEWEIHSGDLKLWFRRTKNSNSSTPPNIEIEEDDEEQEEEEEEEQEEVLPSEELPQPCSSQLIVPSVAESDVASRSVHQDEDYIYPSLGSSSDEDEKLVKASRFSEDKSWCPSSIKSVSIGPKGQRPLRIGKTKVAVEKGLEAAAASKKSTETVTEKPVSVKKIPKPSVVARSPSQATCSDTKIPVQRPKKGKTTKQRLSKILKMHKMIR